MVYYASRYCLSEGYTTVTFPVILNNIHNSESTVKTSYICTLCHSSHRRKIHASEIHVVGANVVNILFLSQYVSQLPSSGTHCVIACFLDK